MFTVKQAHTGNAAACSRLIFIDPEQRFIKKKKKKSCSKLPYGLCL